MRGLFGGLDPVIPVTGLFWVLSYSTTLIKPPSSVASPPGRISVDYAIDMLAHFHRPVASDLLYQT